MSVLDRLRLDGKRAFVTGGSRGLGKEIALAFADVGADLVIVGRNERSLEKIANDIRAMGRRADWIVGDLGDNAACEKVCEQVVSDFGPIDILVNNVGGRRIPTPTIDLSTEDWLKYMDLNLTSTFICTRVVGKAMIQRGAGGRIINIASISGLVTNRNIGGKHYETAKAAVIQFTKTVAVDWAEHGVTANAICPGGFWTEPNQGWAKSHPEVVERFKAQVPTGDYGRPEDLGPLAVYLASEASSYMTGAALVIDGGYTLS